MADIIVNYSRDILKGTIETLKASELKDLVGSGMKVSIKPNMVNSKPPASGSTTHVEIVEGIILYLKDTGVQHIEIIESSWTGGDTRQAYRVCGYEALSKEYGVPLYDLKDGGARKVKSGEFDLEVCDKVLETDFLINVPVLKAHCQTLMTCCLKNLKGCIPDKEKRRYHAIGLHRPIAQLNKVIKTGFCVVDGICGDLSFEEGGSPVERNMILAGRDPLLVDSYCAGLIGYRPGDIEYIRIAAQLGVGRLYGPESIITELNADGKPAPVKANAGLAARLAKHVNEDKACSACYSALICALHTAGKPAMAEKINIGQGFRGKSGKLGCGNCTSGCDRYVKGCPAKAVDVVELLKTL